MVFSSEISSIGQNLLETLEQLEQDAARHGDVHSDDSGDELDINFEDPDKRDLQLRYEALEAAHEKMLARMLAVKAELDEVSRHALALNLKIRAKGLDLSTDVLELQRMVAHLQLENDELRASGGVVASSKENDENLVIEDGSVLAGSPEKLIDAIFVKSVTDQTYPTDIMLTYQFVPIKASVVMDSLEAGFSEAGDDKVRQSRLNTALQTWITMNSTDIKQDGVVRSRLEELISTLGANPALGQKIAAQLQKALNNALNKTFSEIKTGQAKADTIDFKTEKPDLLAKQLTLMHFALFKMITPGMLLRYKVDILLLKRTQLMTVWVKNEIEKTKKPNKIVQKFIEVAEGCRILNNFNAAFALVEGLHAYNADVEKMANKMMRKFPELEKLINPDKGYKNYQDVMKTKPRPCIPYFKLIVNKLNAIMKMPEKFDDGPLVNYARLKPLASMAKDLNSMQMEKDYMFPQEPEVLAYLSVFGQKTTAH